MIAQLADRAIGNPGQRISEPCLWIDIVQPSCPDQRTEHGGPFAAPIGPAKQPGFPAERDAAQRALGGIVGKTDPTIIEEAG